MLRNKSARLAQLAERCANNADVNGSIPLVGIFFLNFRACNKCTRREYEVQKTHPPGHRTEVQFF